MERRTFAGLPVVIENPRGSFRHWHDREGHASGSTLMLHDYGFIEGHVGSDGDELDCYLGPHEAAQEVHVVHQLATPDYKRHDEDKVFLGFPSTADARSAYCAHRNDDDKAIGGMSSMPLDSFKAKLQRRGGTGKIRAERDGGVMLNRTSETPAKHEHGAKVARQGDAINFDGLASEGRVRTGVWDRICVPGRNVKDGDETEFTAETLAEMARNFSARGDMVMIDWNHQSSYAHENGRPAPALGFYGALAVVFGNQLVACEYARGVPQTPPNAAELDDGLWGLRSEVTECGHELLPSFKYVSPTFTPMGTDQQSNPVGYCLLAVAATNTPWQAGTQITFDRGVQAMAYGEEVQIGDKVRVWMGPGGTPELQGVVTEIRGNLVMVRDASGRVESHDKSEVSRMSAKMDQGAQTMATGLKVGDRVRFNLKHWNPTGKDEWETGTVGSIDTNGNINIDSAKGMMTYYGSQAHYIEKMEISFSATTRGANHMGNMTAAAKLVGLEGSTDARAVRSACLAMFEGEMKKEKEADGEQYAYGPQADALEEMARAYEDANFEEEGDDLPPHVTMRKMAAKFRKMAGMMAAGDPPFGGKETPEEEAAEEATEHEGGATMQDEKDEEKKAMAMMARKLGLPPGASASRIATAMEARTVGLDKVGQLEKRIAEMEASKLSDVRTERKRAAEVTFSQAVAHGRTKAEKRDAFLAAYERNPKDADALLFSPGTFPSTDVLMSRMTTGGAPVGQSIREGSSMNALDQRVVTMSALGSGAKALVFGETLAAHVSALADSDDPRVRARIDRELPEGTKGTQYESYERYMAAERITKKERPDLLLAASEDA